VIFFYTNLTSRNFEQKIEHASIYDAILIYIIDALYYYYHFYV